MSSEEPQVETTSVNMEFSEVKLAEDKEGTKTMFISALALDEGVWNGMYFNAEDIQEKIETLNGRRVLVSHEFENPDDVKGWVEGVSSDGVASLRVFDNDTITRVQDGELNAVSVGVQISQKNGMATILDFNEISLTGNPACATCTISEYEVAMLEKNPNEETNMTDEETATIIDEPENTLVIEELCACDPVAETPTLEEVEEVGDEWSANLEAVALVEKLNAELAAVKEEASKSSAYIAELETDRRLAEMNARVEILLDEARFKPAHSEKLVSFLMTLSDSQMNAWTEVESGLGAVVPLDDLAETGEFSPTDKDTAKLASDKTEFRRQMGFKE